LLASSTRSALASAVAVLSLLAACGGGGGDGGVTTPPTAVFTSLTLTPSPVAVVVTGTQQLTAKAFDQSNNPISNVAITFSSSDETVATVSAGGLVTGVKLGNATITASGTKDGTTKTATAAIAVGPIPTTANVTAGDNLQFDPKTVTIVAGGSVTWNIQSTDHNVTFDGGNGTPANVGTGHNTSATRKFDVPGTYAYTCTLHSGMNGSVIVR
jgi:plastocyanin